MRVHKLLVREKIGGRLIEILTAEKCGRFNVGFL